MKATGLAELIAVLTSELQIGASLRENLENQRQAIISWDARALGQHVEEREKQFVLLAQLEARRVTALAELPYAGVQDNLSKLMTLIPANCIEQRTLCDLQQRCRKLFTDLIADEQRLQALKNSLVNHLREAMSRLVTDSRPLYGQTGLTTARRAGNGLIHENA